VISLSIAYTLFTVYAIINVFVFGATMSSGGAQLKALNEAGQLGPGGMAFIELQANTATIATLVWAACTIGVYLGALLFLIITYRRNRRSG
jgi:hypothetical protein